MLPKRAVLKQSPRGGLPRRPLSLPALMIFKFLIRYNSQGLIPDYLVEDHKGEVSRGKA